MVTTKSCTPLSEFERWALWKRRLARKKVEDEIQAAHEAYLARVLQAEEAEVVSVEPGWVDEAAIRRLIAA